MKYSSAQEKGSTHLLAVLAVVAVAGVVAFSIVPVTRHYDYPASQVQGVSVPSTQSAKITSDSGKTAVVQRTGGAVSKFPLKIDPATNSLMVTTPAGTKTVTVLPEAAIANIKASRIMDDVDSEVTSGSLASVRELVQLEEKNGVLAYQINGQKKYKLFGFIPIRLAVSAFVSAESGQIVESQTSFLGKILNKLSF